MLPFTIYLTHPLTLNTLISINFHTENSNTHDQRVFENKPALQTSCSPQTQGTRIRAESA